MKQSMKTAYFMHCEVPWKEGLPGFPGFHRVGNARGFGSFCIVILQICIVPLALPLYVQHARENTRRSP